MDSKKFTKHLVALLFFIFIINFLANKFHWYYSIWYFDMIMHTLGGFWVGLLALWFFPPKVLNFKSIATTLCFVLLVGLGWEVFEFLVNERIAQNPFGTMDTSSDIFFDLLGGAFAILYFLKRVMRAEKNKVI